MRYFVTLGDRTFEIELGGEQALVDGRPVRAELRALPAAGTRHLLADAASHVVLAAAGSDKGVWHVQIDGERYSAEVVDERTRAIRAMTSRGAAAAGPKPVRAPMPGLIVRIEVEEGATVKAGQGIVIVEAMKMENELKAESAGIVKRIHVAAGQVVEKGHVLVELEAVE
jgi:biotin carboxyl carrier protein